MLQNYKVILRKLIISITVLLVLLLIKSREVWRLGIHFDLEKPWPLSHFIMPIIFAGKKINFATREVL